MKKHKGKTVGCDSGVLAVTALTGHLRRTRFLTGAATLSMLMSACASHKVTFQATDTGDARGCSKRVTVPAITSSVVMTAVDPVPTISVRVGQSFRVVVMAVGENVAEPNVVGAKILCQATTSRPGHQRAVVFLATAPGSTALTSGFVYVNPGLGQPTFQVTVSVAKRVD